MHLTQKTGVQKQCPGCGLVFAIPVLPKTGLPIFGAIFDFRKPRFFHVKTGNFE